MTSLNAELAEKLLGWKHIKDIYWDDGNGMPRLLLNLSGSWEGCGMILEAMRARGYEYDLQSYAEYVTASFDKSLSGGGVYSTSHPNSMKVAVALAARKAVEAES